MGAEAEERVVSHLPLVSHVVAEMAGRLPTHVAREDLASAGRLALTQASAAFDASRGVPFAAYARTRIRGAILDELRSVDWASRGVRARSRARETAVEGLLTRLGRTPTQEEVATALGTSTDDVASLDTDLHRSVVLSLQGFGDGVDVDGFVATRVAGPEQVLLHRERTAYLIAAVQELPDRLRTVVVGWFFEDRPMAEIAVELGVSESRVSQLRAEAMTLLHLALSRHLEGRKPEVSSALGSGGVAARRREAYVAAVGAHSDLRTRLALDTRPGWASPAAVDGVA